MALRTSLPKAQKLPPSLIPELFKYGKSLYGTFLLVKYLGVDASFSGYRILVSAKVAKTAVLRNRLKRQLRNMVVKHKTLPSSIAFILLLRKPFLKEDRKLVEEEITHMIQGLSR